MTESALRSKVANWLTSYVGLTEGGTKHKEILSIFNKSGLCSRYTMTVNDAWCATAVSAAFIACGLAGKPGSGSLFECVDCGCDRVVSMAKTQGIWVENDAYVPKQGDVILYAWSDSGSGDCTLSTDHIGIVYSVSGTTIKVIEGNISDTVGYRTLQVNGRYIRGYVTPQYSKFATATTTTTSTATTVDYSPCVASGMQKFTNKTGASLPVYYSSRMLSSEKIGSLNAGEVCYCFGKVYSKVAARWMWLVAYELDAYPGDYKVGYVDDGGSTNFK